MKRFHGSIEEGPASSTFVLWPHRSLNAAGVLALIVSVAVGFAYAVFATTGLHSSPVLITVGLTFLGLNLALWQNSRTAVLREIIEISPDQVRVTRESGKIDAHPVEFNTARVRIEVSTDRYVEHRITLREGERKLMIGAFLSPEERRNLADALQQSLRAASAAA